MVEMKYDSCALRFLRPRFDCRRNRVTCIMWHVACLAGGSVCSAQTCTHVMMVVHDVLHEFRKKKMHVSGNKYNINRVVGAS